MGSIAKEGPPSKGLNLVEQISQKTSGLIQSDKHRDLLDIIDLLRSNGVDHYVDLPQIIILRRGKKSEFKVHIQPSASRSEQEKAKLLKFSERTTDQKTFGKIIEAAKIELGLSGAGPDAKVFSTDVLRIESTSPMAPNLTLVDLPGLFGASDKNQSDDDAALVQNLVVSYMKQKRSIILAVVSADQPFPNQPVTKFARDIDALGARTLGLITKPDKISRGSESEKYYVDMAQNRNVPLKLGWHVLRNKGDSTADDTIEQREAREAEFFSESSWGNALQPEQLGVVALRERLRSTLWKQINDGLPGVKSDVQSGIKDCSTKLLQLGKSRSSKMEKHSYLHKISGNLSFMIQAAIDGVYADPFFASFPGQQDAFERRLRANMQKILTIYAGKMCIRGHALEIVEDDQEPIRTSPSDYIMRSSYLEVVEELMVECRGRELPGTFNPLVVGDLFSRQCKPWEAITQNLAEEVHEAAAMTFNKMLSEICDENTRLRLMQGIIQPSLHELRKALKNKIDELLRPHLSIHPITYNYYLTENVQKIQGDRHDRAFDALSLAGCGVTTSTARNSETVPLFKLLTNLKNGTRPDVKEYSVSLAADVAAAYYKVALKKFIDDVSVNAVEACLVQHLPKVFSPNVVWDLSDEQVENLGSEDASTVAERAELQKKLDILEKGLKGLDAFTSRSGVHAL